MKRDKIANWGVRMLVYCVGLFILALGIAFSVQSDLGVSPFSSIAYTLSQLTHGDMGFYTAVSLVSCVFVQWILLRKEFRLCNGLQIISSSLFGFVMTMAGKIVGDLEPSNFFVQLGLNFIGIQLVAIGVLLYMGPRVLPLSTLR